MCARLPTGPLLQPRGQKSAFYTVPPLRKPGDVSAKAAITETTAEGIVVVAGEEGVADAAAQGATEPSTVVSADVVGEDATATSSSSSSPADSSPVAVVEAAVESSSSIGGSSSSSDVEALEAAFALSSSEGSSGDVSSSSSGSEVEVVTPTVVQESAPESECIDVCLGYVNRFQNHQSDGVQPEISPHHCPCLESERQAA